MCAILCFGRNNANPIFRTNNSVNKTPTDPKVKYMKAGGNGDNPIQRKLATKIARTTAVILMRRFPDMLNSFMLAHKAELGATENGYSLDSCQLFVTKQRIHSSLKHTIILHIETTNVTGYALRESTGNCSNASPLICDVHVSISVRYTVSIPETHNTCTKTGVSTLKCCITSCITCHIVPSLSIRKRGA